MKSTTSSVSARGKAAGCSKSKVHALIEHTRMAVARRFRGKPLQITTHEEQDI